jgi:hypothetical protein
LPGPGEGIWRPPTEAADGGGGRDGGPRIRRGGIRVPGPGEGVWSEPLAAALEKRSDRTALIELIDRFNIPLQGSGVSLALVRDLPAEMIIAFASKDRWPELMETYDTAELASSDAWFRAFENESYEIFVAIIVVDAGMSDGIRDFLIAHEMMNALGAYGDTKTYRESVLYDDRAYRPGMETPSPVDLQLLRFLYRCVRPGDDEASVRAAFASCWSSSEVPSR